ncbi:Lrp/AsnC family transcriptional regulator [Candidatus Poriferisocius sp.]|uniref:Lrp/AsnC family transcriptional regulator n=1 Tax=Candidatus Poriferisocius sp. TaxID=3101276 RepID=UPI003B52673C
MAAAFDIDEIDKAIIRELQNDGRMPYARIAPMVGLSQAATRQRVNRLMERGVVQIVAVTDPVGLGVGYQAWIGINVSGDARSVAEALAEINEAEYVVIVAGRFDVIAEIVCADSEAFISVVNDRVRAIPGVIDIETLHYLRLVKQTYNWGTG